MKPNIIILTHGWTGSSVFAGLLGRAEYWLGSETVQKSDYDTFENADLVGMNRLMLDALAKELDHEHQFQFDDVLAIERASDNLDLRPYRDFVDRCSAHGPWVWKDPRLTWTIRVWSRVLDLDNTAFLILTRDDLQAWISANVRRHVQSRRFTRNYNRGITQSNISYVHSVGHPLLQLSFEDLLLEPERTLDKINSFYGLRLTMEDLKAVFDGQLYRKNRDWGDMVRAGLIYLKNFRERDGRRR